MRLRNLESRVFVALVLATTVFFLWMVRSFLMPVFWAAVFAILFQPLFLWLKHRFRGRRTLAALAATLAVVFAVLVPSALLVGAVAQQALGLYQRVASGEVNLQAPMDFVERHLPAVTRFLADYGIGAEQVRTSLESAAIFATQYIAGQALALGQNVLIATILFLLMLYLLFFFFRDGDRILGGIIRAVPMGDLREERLMRKFAQVSRATVKGTLVVAVVQGALGGVLFSMVGIQAAVFWGVMMGILSLLPAVGPALVWLPAAVILMAMGAIWQGLAVIVCGILIVSMVDNLLRPILIGRDTHMPDYLVLVATLGGLTMFGLAGFVAGPIVAALFLVMWDMFSEEYAPLDSSRRLVPSKHAPPGSGGPPASEFDGVTAPAEVLRTGAEEVAIGETTAHPGLRAAPGAGGARGGSLARTWNSSPAEQQPTDASRSFTVAVTDLANRLRDDESPSYAHLNRAAARIDHLGRLLHGLGFVRHGEIAACFMAAIGELRPSNELPERSPTERVARAVAQLEAVRVHLAEGTTA
jgi:predicted PurR-regulated permease PerM